MKPSVLLVPAVLAFFCFPLLAQDPTPAPELKPGETWKYHSIDGYKKMETDVYAQTVKEAKPDGYTLEWESLKTGTKLMRTFTKDWNPIIRGEGLAHNPYYPYFKFPLSVGKTWS